MSGSARRASQRASERIHTTMRFAPPFDGPRDLQNDSGSEFEYQPSSNANSGVAQSKTARRATRRRNMRAREEPREVPCAPCINRMDQTGPDSLCRSQESPNTVACFACAKVGRKCVPVPDAALPHARALQEAASRINTGETIHNWGQLMSDAKEAILMARQNPLFVPNPPVAIDHGAALSPEPSQSPKPDQEAPQLDNEAPQLSHGTHPLDNDAPRPGQEAPADGILAAILRNNELVAKTNQIMRRVVAVASAFARGESPPPTQ